MKYSNGDVYEGAFEYDLCSKIGKMTYKDGSVYEGFWLNGLVGIFDHTAAFLSSVKVDLSLQNLAQVTIKLMAVNCKISQCTYRQRTTNFFLSTNKK